MKKTIFKYQLLVQDEQQILIHKNAKFLHVQVQNGIPCLWAIVDPSNEEEEITILTFGTGNSFDEQNVNLYLGSYQLHNGRFVGHLFVGNNQ